MLATYSARLLGCTYSSPTNAAWPTALLYNTQAMDLTIWGCTIVGNIMSRTHRLANVRLPIDGEYRYSRLAARNWRCADSGKILLKSVSGRRHCGPVADCQSCSFTQHSGLSTVPDLRRLSELQLHTILWAVDRSDTNCRRVVTTTNDASWKPGQGLEPSRGQVFE